ncbi:hypothetical protein F5887DRAFT_1082365 [Amanita rubescens]|nr:hypothetical protein F5887DRAFT_1082365 [Amanita rubescens]
MVQILKSRGQEQTSLALENKQNGEIETFKVGDCAFIAHRDLDLDQRPIAGEDYWKGRINGIYKYKGDDYVVVAWFYTKQHLVDVGVNLNEMQKFRLGRAELVASNHEDVVQVSSIEDKCKIIYFDDTEPLQDLVNVNEWFYRLEATFGSRRGSNVPKIKGINASCICGQMYCPQADRQRFCKGCNQWFHEGCMGPAAAQQDESEGSQTTLNLMKKVPFYRGYGGEGDSGFFWEIVGSYRRLNRFRNWVKNDRVPQDWEKLLDKKFVQQVLLQTWVYYRCPNGCEAPL